MTKHQFETFCDFRTEFKSYCHTLNKNFSEVLQGLVREAQKNDTPSYPLETAVVYNTALDEIKEESDINLIVIGDNPGKDEQLAKNNKYLVGQSGKIAAGFFSKHADLRTDFRKNVIILNKTPVHTAKTKHLSFVEKNGDGSIKSLITDSQIFMAKKTAELHHALLADAADGRPELWLVGYGELKNRGVFLRYRDALKSSYADGTDNAWERVFVFQHFSMNRFSIDLNEFCTAHETLGLVDALHALGKQHKAEIFGA